MEIKILKILWYGRWCVCWTRGRGRGIEWGREYYDGTHYYLWLWALGISITY